MKTASAAMRKANAHKANQPDPVSGHKYLHGNNPYLKDKNR